MEEKKSIKSISILLNDHVYLYYLYFIKEEERMKEKWKKEISYKKYVCQMFYMLKVMFSYLYWLRSVSHLIYFNKITCKVLKHELLLKHDTFTDMKLVLHCHKV